MVLSLRQEKLWAAPWANVKDVSIKLNWKDSLRSGVYARIVDTLRRKEVCLGGVRCSGDE